MRILPSLTLTFCLATPVTAQTTSELLKAAEDALNKKKPQEALALATKAIEAEPKNVEPLIVRANVLELLERYTDAVADYTKIIELDRNRHNAYHFRGLVHFKAGKIKESIGDFDKYIELRPKAKASHWQRGISYYYGKRYEDGRKQFEGYQNFDSNDVENAVWRFMCMAWSDGLQKARRYLLKVGEDTRVPMRKVYDIYKGDAKPEDVFAAAREGKPDAAQLNQRLFYAHLYVGIYLDLMGTQKAALEHLNKATNDHRIGHYMWDVARIHRDLLAAELKGK